MPRQCQFPVHFSDNRRCYRSCSAGFTCILAVLAILLAYAGFRYADTWAETPQALNLPVSLTLSDINRVCASG